MKQTYIDSLVSIPSMELLKASLPYMKIQNKYKIYIIIKYFEFMRLYKMRNIIESNIYCNDIFEELKEYMPEGTMENIEMIKSMTDLMSDGDFSFDLNDDNLVNGIFNNFNF